MKKRKIASDTMTNISLAKSQNIFFSTKQVSGVIQETYTHTRDTAAAFAVILVCLLNLLIIPEQILHKLQLHFNLIS